MNTRNWKNAYTLGGLISQMNDYDLSHDNGEWDVNVENKPYTLPYVEEHHAELLSVGSQINATYYSLGLNDCTLVLRYQVFTPDYNVMRIAVG